MAKITQYPNDRTNLTLTGTDELDVSADIGGGSYESMGLTIANLEAYLNGNLTFLSSGDNISELNNDSGYLTSFTETDPVFSASPAASVINSGGGTLFLADDGTYKSAGADGNGIYDGSGSLSGATDVTLGLNDLSFTAGASVNAFSIKNASTTLFSVDASNERIGIGTTSPAFDVDFAENKNSDAFWRFRNSNAGTSARTGFLTYNDVATRYLAQYLHSSTYAGSPITGTSIARANTMYFNSGAGTDNSGSLIFGGTPLIGITTSKGYRLDANGMRIGDSNTMHTTNTVGLALEVDGNTQIDGDLDLNGQLYAESSTLNTPHFFETSNHVNGQILAGWVGTTSNSKGFHLGGAKGVSTYNNLTSYASVSSATIDDFHLRANNVVISSNITPTGLADAKLVVDGDFRTTTGNVAIRGAVDLTKYLRVYGNTQIDGSLRINDGTQQAGYVFTSDASGNGSWQAAAGGADGNGIYDGNGTVPSATVATLTDNLTFQGNGIALNTYRVNQTSTTGVFNGFQHQNSAAAKTTYGFIGAYPNVATAGAEYGELAIGIVKAGSLGAYGSADFWMNQFGVGIGTRPTSGTNALTVGGNTKIDGDLTFGAWANKINFTGTVAAGDKVDFGSDFKFLFQSATEFLIQGANLGRLKLAPAAAFTKIDLSKDGLGIHTAPVVGKGLVVGTAAGVNGDTQINGELLVNNDAFKVLNTSAATGQIETTGASSYSEFMMKNDGGATIGSLLSGGSTYTGLTLLQDSMAIRSGGAATRLIVATQAGQATYFIHGTGMENSNTYMKSTSTGLLLGNGIGASNPTDRLQVNGTTLLGGNTQIDGQLVLDHTAAIPLIIDGTTNSLAQYKVGGIAKAEFGVVGTNSYIYSVGGNGFAIGVNGNSSLNDFRILSNKNILVGTGADQGSKFQVTGSGYVNGNFIVDGAGSIFRPPVLTTTERDALTPTAGDVVYNSTTNKHQGYNGTIWNDFY